MTRIFISYSRANLFIARTIVERLQSKYSVWFDYQSIPGGSEWEHEIKKGLKTAHIILVLVTPASAKSQWVAKEIAIGRELRRDVIPVIVERLESVETDLKKLGIEHIQALDFTVLELDLAYEQLFRQIDKVGIAWARFHPLIRDLKARYPNNAAAAEELGNLGDSRALPYLTEMMFSDRDGTARGTAAVALGKIRDERAVDDLIRALDEGYTTYPAIEALGMIGGKKAVDRLVHVFGDEDTYRENLDVWAISALGQTGHPDAIPPLIDIAMNGHQFKVEKALEALANFSDERILEPVIKILKTGDAELREQAVQLFVRLRGEHSVEKLLELINDPDKDVRGRAIIELGDLGDRRSVDAIIGILGDEYTVIVAVDALRKIGDAKAIKPLLEIKAKYPDFRVQAEIRRALEELGYEEQRHSVL